MSIFRSVNYNFAQLAPRPKKAENRRHMQRATGNNFLNSQYGRNTERAFVVKITLETHKSHSEVREKTSSTAFNTGYLSFCEPEKRR